MTNCIHGIMRVDTNTHTRIDDPCPYCRIDELEAELERARCTVTDHQKYLAEAQHRIEIQSSVVKGCEAKLKEYRMALEGMQAELDEAKELIENHQYCIPTTVGVNARYITDDSGKGWLEFPDGSGCSLWEIAEINEYANQMLDRTEQAETDRDNYYKAYQLYMERALDAEKEVERLRDLLNQHETYTNENWYKDLQSQLSRYQQGEEVEGSWNYCTCGDVHLGSCENCDKPDDKRVKVLVMKEDANDV